MNREPQRTAQNTISLITGTSKVASPILENGPVENMEEVGDCKFKTIQVARGIGVGVAVDGQYPA